MEAQKQDKRQYANTYLDELLKFVGKQGIVTYLKGNEVVELEGTIKGLNTTHLSVAVMTDTEKVLIKHVIEVRRKRDSVKKPSKEKAEGVA